MVLSKTIFRRDKNDKKCCMPSGYSHFIVVCRSKCYKSSCAPLSIPATAESHEILNANLMQWLQASNLHKEMPLSQISQSNSIVTNASVNPGTSTQIPLGHPSTLINDRAAPPSYEEALDPNAPPPSYDSLFGRMREAHKVSKGVFDFFKNIIVLLLGTIGCTIILGLTIVVPTCMIVIGGLYLNDCPQGEYIPVYVLVAGCFGVFKNLLYLSARVRQRQEERDEERLLQSPTQRLINCFMIGWFIIGSMWVYKEYEPNYDPTLGKYCNKTLYLFAFWLITLTYIWLGVMTVCLCTISVASIAFQRCSQI